MSDQPRACSYYGFEDNGAANPLEEVARELARMLLARKTEKEQTESIYAAMQEMAHGEQWGG